MEEDAVVTWWQGVFSYLHPALLWYWFTGPHSWIYRIYRNIKSGFDPRFRRRRRLLSWMGQGSGRDVTDLASVWRDGTILCDLIHRSCPSACLGHEESHVQDTFRHAQALAYRCLLLQPAFTEDELSRPELTPHIEKRLFRYLQSLRQAISKKQLNRSAEEESDAEAHVAEEYIARGMGLIMASTSQRAIFYVYSRDGSSLMDIHIEIRGPGDDFGSILVTESESYDNPTGASITVEYRLTEEYLRVSYQPRSAGHHELSISRHRYNVPGSPFLVSVDEISEKIPKKRFNSVEWFTEDEESRQKELQEKKKKAKVKYRIVDFVTEKMYLTEDGKLLNIPPQDVQCVTPPPPEFPAPIPPPTPDIPLLTPPSPTSSTDSRSQCKKGRTLSPRPRRKRGERTKWMNIKQERMKYIIVKPQKAELKRVSDAAAQVTLEFQPSMFQERCKRIVTVCDYLLQHCPRQTSLEIISGAGHILQSLQSDKDRNENSFINKQRVSEPDEDDDVFVPATAPSPTTVRTITYPERCRSVSLTHIKDGSNDNVQKEAGYISRDSDTERRRESDSSITHLASEARKCFRYEGNTKLPGRRTSFSSIYQVSDSKSQNKSTVDEDSYDLLTVTDDHIIYSEERPDHTAIDADIKLVNYKQFSNEKCSSELRVNDSTPDGVLLEQISDPSTLVDVCSITTHMGEPFPKSTQGSDTLNVINNSDLNRQLNKEERFSEETNDKIILPNGNNVGKIIARFETNLSLEQDRVCSLSSNLAVTCLEIEKSNVKNTSEPPLFKDPVGDSQINFSKENYNLDNDKKLQIEYLKSIGAPLSTIRSKIQLFEKGIVKETCTSTIQAPNTETGFNSLDASKILHTRDQNRISTEVEAVNIFRAEPAMVVSKHYAELQEIRVNTEPVIEGIIFDFQPKRSPSKTSSAQVLTDKVQMQGKTCESEYKLDTWDPGILQGSHLIEANVLSESTVVGDNYIPFNNQHSNPIISEVDNNKEHFPGLTIKEKHVCLTESTSNDKEKSNMKLLKNGSKSIDQQQLTFHLTTEETPENTISGETLSLLTSILIPNDIHTTEGSNHTEEKQIKFFTNENDFQQENCLIVRGKPINEHTMNNSVNQPSAETGLQDPIFDGGSECHQSEQQECILTKSQLRIVNDSKTCQINVNEFESPRYEILLESQSNETVACIEGDTNQNSELATIHAIIEGSEQNHDKPNLDTSQREEVTEHLRNEDVENKHDATKFLDREMSNGEHISEKGKYLQENTVMAIENRDSAKEELETVAEVLPSESDLTAPCINASTDDTSLRKYEFPTETIQPLVEVVTKHEDISDEMNNVCDISECGVVSSDIVAIDLNSKEDDHSLNKIDPVVIFHKISTEAELIEDSQQIDFRKLTINVIDDKKEQTSDIILVQTEENLDLKSIEENVNTQIKKEQYNIPISGFTQKLVKIFENIYDQSPINNFNKDPNDRHTPIENYVNPVSLESLTYSSKASVACSQLSIASNETNGVEVKGLTKKLVKLFENIYEPVSTERTINSTTEHSAFLENVESITNIAKDINSSVIQKGPALNQNAVEDKANIASSTSSSFNGLTKRLIEVFDDISDQKNKTHTFCQVNLDDSTALSDTIISLPLSFSEQEAEQCSHGSTNILKKSKANQVDFVGDEKAMLISEKECSTNRTQNVTDEQGGQEGLIIQTERNPEKTVTSGSDKIIELNSNDPIRNEDCEQHMQLGQCNIKVVTKDGIHSENQSVNEFFHANEDNLEQTSTLTFGDLINGKASQETGNTEVITKETISFEQTDDMSLTGRDRNLAYDVGSIHEGAKGSAKDIELESKIGLEVNIPENPNVINQAITGTVRLEQDDIILLKKEYDQTQSEDGSLKQEGGKVLAVEIKCSLEQSYGENINICNQTLVSDDYLMIKQPVIQLERKPNKANKIKSDKCLDSNVSNDIPIVEEPLGKQEQPDYRSSIKGNIDCFDLVVPEVLTITDMPLVESLEPTVAKNLISVNQPTVKQKEDENKVVTNGRKDCIDLTIDERLNITEQPEVESVNNKTRDMLIKNKLFIEPTFTEKLSIVDQPAIKLKQNETKVVTFESQDSLYLAGSEVLTITEQPREESKNDKTKNIPIENEGFLEPSVNENRTIVLQPSLKLEHVENEVMTIKGNDFMDPSEPKGLSITEEPVVESDKDKTKDMAFKNGEFLKPIVNDNLAILDQPTVTLEHSENKVMIVKSNDFMYHNVPEGLFNTKQSVVESNKDKNKVMPIENEGFMEPIVTDIHTIFEQPTVTLKRVKTKVLTFDNKDCLDVTVDKCITITGQPAVESENNNFKVIPIEKEGLLQPTVTENLTIDDQPIERVEHDENKAMTIESNDFMIPSVLEGLIITKQPEVESDKDKTRDMPIENEEFLDPNVNKNLTIIDQPTVTLEHNENKVMTIESNYFMNPNVPEGLIFTKQPVVESENDNFKDIPIENEGFLEPTVIENLTIDDQLIEILVRDKNKVMTIESNNFIDPTVPKDLIITEEPVVESDKDKDNDMPIGNEGFTEPTLNDILSIFEQPTVTQEQDETKVLTFEGKGCLDLTVVKCLTITEQPAVESGNDNIIVIPIEKEGLLDPTVTENLTIDDEPVVTLELSETKVMTIESNDLIDPNVPEGLIITEDPEVESDKDKTKNMQIENGEFLEPNVNKNLTIVDQPPVTLEHNENKVMTIASNDFMDPKVPKGIIITKGPVVESENYKSKDIQNENIESMESTVVENLTTIDHPTVTLEHDENKVITIVSIDFMDPNVPEGLIPTEEPMVESENDKSKVKPNENKESMELTVAGSHTIVNQPAVQLNQGETKVLTLESKDSLELTVDRLLTITGQPVVKSETNNFKDTQIENRGFLENTVTENLTIDDQPIVTLEHDDNKLMTIESNDFLDPSEPQDLIITKEPVVESENYKTKDFPYENNAFLIPTINENLINVEQATVTLEHNENKVMTIESNYFMDPNVPEGLIFNKQPVIESENDNFKDIPIENEGFLEPTVIENLTIDDQLIETLVRDKNKVMTNESNNFIDPSVPKDLIITEEPVVESDKDQNNDMPIANEGFTEPTVTDILTIFEQPTVTQEQDETKVLTFESKGCLDLTVVKRLTITEQPAVESGNDNIIVITIEKEGLLDPTVTENLTIDDEPAVTLELSENKVMTIESNDLIDPNVPKGLIITDEPEVESDKDKTKNMQIENGEFLEPNVNKNLTILDQPPVTLEHNENKVMTIASNDFMDPKVPKGIIITKGPVVESENYKSKDIQNENIESVESTVTENLTTIDHPTVTLEHDENKVITIESNDFVDPSVPQSLIITKEPVVESENYKTKDFPYENKVFLIPTINENLINVEQATVTLEHNDKKVMTIESNYFMDPNVPEGLIFNKQPVIESENDNFKDIPIENEGFLEPTVIENLTTDDQLIETLVRDKNKVMTNESNNFIDPSVPKDLIITEEPVVESDKDQNNDMPIANEGFTEPTVTDILTIFEQPTVTQEQDETKVLTFESKGCLDLTVVKRLTITEQPAVESGNDNIIVITIEKEGLLDPTVTENLTIDDEPAVTLELSENKVMTIESNDLIDPNVPEGLIITEEPEVESDKDKTKNMQIENGEFLEPNVNKNLTIVDQPPVTLEHNENKVMTIASNDFMDPKVPKGIIITKGPVVESVNYKSKDIQNENIESVESTVAENLTTIDHPTVTLEHDENKVITIESNDFMDPNVPKGLIPTEEPMVESENDKSKVKPNENKESMELTVAGSHTIVNQPVVKLKHGETKVLTFDSKDSLELIVDKGLTITGQPVVKSETDNFKDMQIENKGFLENTVTENLTIDDQPIVTLEHDDNKLMTIESNDFLDPSVPQGLIITKEPVVESEIDKSKDFPYENNAFLIPTINDNLINVDQANVTLEHNDNKVMTLESNYFMDPNVPEGLIITEEPVVESENEKCKYLPNENNMSMKSTVTVSLIIVDQPAVKLEQGETKILTLGKDCLDLTVDKCLTITEQPVVISEDDNFKGIPIETIGFLKPTVTEYLTIDDQNNLTLEHDEIKVMTIESNDFMDPKVPEGRFITEEPVDKSEYEKSKDISNENKESMELTVAESPTISYQPAGLLEIGKTNVLAFESKDCLDLTVNKRLTDTEQPLVKSGNDNFEDIPIENEGLLEQIVTKNLTIDDELIVTLENNENKIMTIESNDFTDPSVPEDLIIIKLPVIESDKHKNKDKPILNEGCLEPTATENLTIDDQLIVTLEHDKIRLMTIESNDHIDPSVPEGLIITEQPVVDSNQDTNKDIPIENEWCLEPTVTRNQNIFEQPADTLEQDETNVLTFESKDYLDSTLDKRLTITEQPVVKSENYNFKYILIENEGFLEPIVTENLTIDDQLIETLERDKNKVMTIESNNFIGPSAPKDIIITEEPEVESENDQSQRMQNENKESIELTVAKSLTIVEQPTVTPEQGETKIITFKNKNCLDLTLDERLTITELSVVKAENNSFKDIPIENEGFSEQTVAEYQTIDDQPIVTLEHDENKVLTFESNDFMDPYMPEGFTITEEPVVESEIDNFKSILIENECFLEPIVTENLIIDNQPIRTLEHDDNKKMTIESNDFMDTNVPEGLIITEEPVVESENNQSQDMQNENKEFIDLPVAENLTIVYQPTVTLKHDENKVMPIESNDFMDPYMPEGFTITEEPVVESENDNFKYILIENEGFLEPIVTEKLTIDNQPIVTLEHDDNKKITIESNDFMDTNVPEGLIITEEPVVKSGNDRFKDMPNENKESMELTVSKSLTIVEQPTVTLEQGEIKVLTFENTDCLDLTVDKRLTITEQPVVKYENYHFKYIPIEIEGLLEPTVSEYATIIEQHTIQQIEDKTKNTTVESRDCLDLTVPKAFTLIEQPAVEFENDETRGNVECLEPTVPENIIIVDQIIVELEQEIMETKTENNSFQESIVNDYCTINERPGFVLEHDATKEIIIENSLEPTVHNELNIFEQHVVVNDETRDKLVENESSLEPTVPENRILVNEPIIKQEEDEKNIVTVESNDFMIVTVPDGLTITEQPVVESQKVETRYMFADNEWCSEPTVSDNHTVVNQPIVTLEHDETKVMKIEGKECLNLTKPEVLTITELSVVVSENYEARDMPVETEECLKPTVSENLTIVDHPTVTLEQYETKVVTTEGRDVIDATMPNVLPLIKQPIVDSENNEPRDMKIKNEAGLEPTVSRIFTIDNQSNVTLEQDDTKVKHIESINCLVLTVPEVFSLTKQPVLEFKNDETRPIENDRCLEQTVSENLTIVDQPTIKEEDDKTTIATVLSNYFMNLTVLDGLTTIEPPVVESENNKSRDVKIEDEECLEQTVSENLTIVDQPTVTLEQDETKIVNVKRRDCLDLSKPEVLTITEIPVVESENDETMDMPNETDECLKPTVVENLPIVDQPYITLEQDETNEVTIEIKDVMNVTLPNVVPISEQPVVKSENNKTRDMKIENEASLRPTITETLTNVELPTVQQKEYKNNILTVESNDFMNLTMPDDLSITEQPVVESKNDETRDKPIENEGCLEPTVSENPTIIDQHSIQQKEYKTKIKTVESKDCLDLTLPEAFTLIEQPTVESENVERPDILLEHDATKEIIIEHSLEPTIHNEFTIFEQQVVVLDQDESKTMNNQDTKFLNINMSKDIPIIEQPIAELVCLKKDGLKLITIQDKNNLEQTTTENPTVDNQLAHILFDPKENKTIAMHIETASNVKQTVTEDLTVYDEVVNFKNYKTKLITEEDEINLDQTRPEDHFVDERQLDKPFVEESDIADSNVYFYKEREGINMCMIGNDATLSEEGDSYLGTRYENKHNFTAKELYLQLVDNINSQSDHTSNKESNSSQTNNSLPLDLIKGDCKGHLPQDISECNLDSKCENCEITSKGFQIINENTKCNERSELINETQFERVSNSFEQKISIASKIKQFIFPESDEYDLKLTDNLIPKENIKENLILMSYRCMEDDVLFESSSNTPEPTILSSAILNKRQNSGGKEQSLVQQLKQRFESPLSNVEICKDFKRLSVFETVALENQEIRGLCGSDNGLKPNFTVFENKQIAAIITDTKKGETKMSTNECNQVCCEQRLVNERDVESDRTIWNCALDPSMSTLESPGQTTKDTFLSNKYSSLINFENEELASKYLFSNTPTEGVRQMLSLDSEMLNNNLLTVEQELSEVLSIEDEELDRSLEKEIYDIEAMETPDVKYDDHFNFQEHNREFVDGPKDVFGIENEKLGIQTQQQIIEIDQMLSPAEAESSIKMSSVNSTCNNKRVIRVDPSLLSFDPMDDEISSLEDEKLDEDILTEISKVESVAYNEGGINEPMITVQDYDKTINFPTVNMEIVYNVNIQEEELDEETQRVLQEVEDPSDITTGCYLSNDNIETSHSAIGFFSGYSTLDGTFSPYPPESKHDSKNCVTEKYKLVPTEYGDLSSYNNNDEAIIEDRMDGDEYGAGGYMVDTDESTKNSTLLQHDMNNYEFFNPATSKSELNMHADSDQVDYYDEVNKCSVEPMLSSLQSETTGAGESFSESLQDFKDINLSLSSESDSSEFHMWSSNIEFGEPGDASTIQESMDFDSIISAPNLDEALKKLERHIQDRGEGFHWLSTRTPSPSLQSLEKCFKDGVPFFDTEEFYSQVSGGIISGNALTSQDYSANENEENTGQIDIWATPCENLPSCTYVQDSLEADGLESECREEQSQDWIISPYQYPRVIFGNTTQMSIIDEEDDLRKSEPTSPQQIKCMNLNIDNTHTSSEIMSSTNDIPSQSSLFDNEINYKAKDIHSLNARFSIDKSDCVNEYNIRDSEQTLIINKYKPEIESCFTNSMLEITAITSAKTNDPEETDKNKISSTGGKLAFQTISLDHNNINRIISENIVQDDIDQSKASLNESNLIFTKNTNTVNKGSQQMYKAPKLTDAKFYAMNKDHVESKIDNDLVSHLNKKDQISSANDEFDCIGNIQKKIIQDDTLSNLNANYSKDKRIREEIKYLLEHNIDSVTEEVINEFSVSERKMYWDAKLKKLQDLESQSSTYSGPKSLSTIKSGTVSKLVSCFGQTNEDVPALPIVQKKTNIYPKTSSYQTINKPGTDHKYKEENIDIAEKTKSESPDQSQCVDTKTTVQSTASMKLVSHWKTYWDDMINDQTENNNSQQRAVYKIPSIQISEDDESGVTTVLYDEISSNHNCNKEILKEEILSPLPTGDNTKIEYLATKIDQEWPSSLNRLNKLYENKSGEENLRQEMTPDETLSSERLSRPVMPRPRSYSAGNIDKEFLTIPTNKSLENSCSDGKSQMHESEGRAQHHNEFKMRFERAKQFFKHLEQSGPGDIKGRDYRSMPRLDLSNKTRKPSVDSDSGPEIKPQRKRDHFRSRRRRRKKEKDSCKIQSAPTSDTETSKRVQRQESYDSFGGSVKIRKVSERFLVKDLFRDVSDKDGFFMGIPNQAAVLASLRSVDDVRAVSPYEMDYGDLKPSTSLGNIPSGFQEEYPYLPTTPIHRFRPRSALGLNLIPRSELLDEKF